MYARERFHSLRPFILKAMITVLSFMTGRIAITMEGIVADYIEETGIPSNQINVTETFTSINKSITFSGFKVSPFNPHKLIDTVVLVVLAFLS